MTKCPCDTTKTYPDCCELIHRNIDNAKTAEDLMRSRYTAFVLANGAYLMKSHHSTTRPVHDTEEIVAWAKSVQWIRLEVLGTTKGGHNDKEGTVHFKAYFFEGGIVQVIEEHSLFEREEEHWVYVGAM
ncbi:YchJ family protein [Aquimarina intermedia]|uniref:SEC-C motif-containing protein n=1 Tax=Aquimarina intermedia TaxID=350814 RepID=A0A5S5CB66_9FLAO|nr:YchJ family metal-binding protein [Aquimarina intermedia]TYP75233.1 SEC-C motif-containing protein [Aquimarina intermedia]